MDKTEQLKTLFVAYQQLNKLKVTLTGAEATIWGNSLEMLRAVHNSFFDDIQAEKKVIPTTPPIEKKGKNDKRK